MRQGYYLPLSLGWLGLCVYWSLIAISAGPNPVWPRADIATPIRLLLLVSMATLALGNAMQVFKARYCTFGAWRRIWHGAE